MNRPDNDYSRLNRKRGRNRANHILNILIAIVVVLIIVTASVIFLSGNGKDKADEKLPETTETETETDEETNNSDEDSNAPDNESEEDQSSKADEEEVLEDKESDETAESEKDEEGTEESGVVTYEPSDDEIIAETMIKTSWEPIGTTQSGDHVSLYDGNSTDWNEKIDALSYATGLSKDAMIVWKIGNGGSPQKSIGIVSSKDKAEKYRVFLEWVNEKGWKPVKMDVLKTLDFDY